MIFSCFCSKNNSGHSLELPQCGSIKYRKVPKFSDARKLCCNLPQIKQRGKTLRIFHPKDVNGIANSEDPDQIAPLGAV